MEEVTTAIIWEAPEHIHQEKSDDWYWALGIIAVAIAIASFFFGNFLFAILILIAAFVVALLSVRKPRIINYAVTTRGVRIDTMLYTYNDLESFYIDEEHMLGPQLLLRSSQLFMPLFVIPIPEEHLLEIEDMISARLPEETLEEPLYQKLLEFFGF